MATVVKLSGYRCLPAKDVQVQGCKGTSSRGASWPWLPAEIAAGETAKQPKYGCQMAGYSHSTTGGKAAKLPLIRKPYPTPGLGVLRNVPQGAL
jgi:hypothetical protein